MFGVEGSVLLWGGWFVFFFVIVVNGDFGVGVNWLIVELILVLGVLEGVICFVFFG